MQSIILESSTITSTAPLSTSTNPEPIERPEPRDATERRTEGFSGNLTNRRRLLIPVVLLQDRGLALVRRICIGCVILAAAIGLGFWLPHNSAVYSHPLSSEHTLTIRTFPGPSSDQVTLHVTYHHPPAIGTYIVAEQIVHRPAENLTFTSVVDAETGLECIHDNNNIGFLLMYHRLTGDLWDTTGRTGGWNGSEISIWQDRLSILIQKFPSIPYSTLPGRS